MVKECVTLHIGQAGCQIGAHLWELFCLEHDILPDGTAPEDKSPGQADEPHNSFFSETASGQHVPRAIFLDTDPTSKEEIMTGDYRKLFHPDNVMGYKQDCKNNYFEGRSMARQYHVVDDVMDRIRMQVDLCGNLQGFFVFQSFGGGTGAGVGTEVLIALHDQFDKKVIFQPVVYPSIDFSSSIVEPYNCIFATNATRSLVDLSFMIDNQAAYTMCTRNLKIANPDFKHLNRIIAQMVSACTTSLRYEAELNASLNEITTNMVPEPIFRYPIMSLSPVRPAKMGKHENFTTGEIIQELFDEKNILCSCGSYMKSNRYLAAVVLLRGTSKTPGAPEDDAASAQSGGSKASGAGKDNPIQFNEVMSALHSMMNPRGAYRKPLRFLPWLASGGFKVGIVGLPPKIPVGFMADTERQGVLLGNTTAVRTLFVRQYTKYLRLLYHKAYIWQFLDANGEIDEFYDAKIGVRELIDAYERLLESCVREENDQGGGRVTLRGKTGQGA